MPFAGLTRWGRKRVPSVGSFANSGALNWLAPRRLRERCFDCLRFGWPMMKVVGFNLVNGKPMKRTVEHTQVKTEKGIFNAAFPALFTGRDNPLPDIRNDGRGLS